MRDNNAIVELLREGADPLAFPDTPAGKRATLATTRESLLKVDPKMRVLRGSPASSPSAWSVRRLSPRRREVLCVLCATLDRRLLGTQNCRAAFVGRPYSIEKRCER